jgi:nucleoside-diphosphate-sugar epimerase
MVLTSRRKPPDDISHWPWIEADFSKWEDCQTLAEAGPFDAIQAVGAVPFATDRPGREASVRERGFSLDDTMHTNIMGTYYLLRIAVENDIDIFVMTGSNMATGFAGSISDTPYDIRYLPLDEDHPTQVEDAYSYSKLADEELLASYTRAYGIRTHTVRSAGIRSPEQRKTIAENVKPITGWNEWLWAWVGSEDVASAQRLLMEQAYEIPPNGAYFCNADDTTALEPTLELIENYRPDLLSKVRDLEGHASLFSNQKLKDTVGWEHKTSWRQHLPDQS